MSSEKVDVGRKEGAGGGRRKREGPNGNKVPSRERNALQNWETHRARREKSA